MPRAAKELDKEDPEYLEKRAKNNEAIKRSREKSRIKARQLLKRSLDNYDSLTVNLSRPKRPKPRLTI